MQLYMYLARGVKPFADDEVDNAPGYDEGGQQVPLQTNQVRDPVSDTQDTVAEHPHRYKDIATRNWGGVGVGFG